MIMDRDFIRFPHTPHLAWLAPGRPRDDKVLDNAEVAELLADEVVVEEKVDGANVGLSVDVDGNLRAQNRGRWLTPGDHPQFGPLWPWMHARADLFRQHLGHAHIVFGEWCFAVHSVHHDRLPDWFLGFDVLDRHDESFWSSTRRNDLLARLEIEPVPQLLRGHTSLAGLKQLLEQAASRVGDGPPEGLYVRRESNDRLIARAKLVRADFVQQIDEHWSRRRMQTNRLHSRSAS
jgi:RNA ligase